MLRPTLPSVAIIALLGAALATICDLNHVTTGTLSYPTPWLFGQPWWTFPGFAVAFAGMALLYAGLVRWLPASIERVYCAGPGSAGELLDSMLLFAFVYLISGFGNDNPDVLTWLFGGTFLLRLALARERVFMTIIAVLLALGGTLAEAALGAGGLVAYGNTELIGVPLWLPGLYLHGAFALRDGMRLFVAGPADASAA